MNGAMQEVGMDSSERSPSEPARRQARGGPRRLRTCTRCKLEVYDVLVNGATELCIVCVDAERRLFWTALTALLGTVEQSQPDSPWWSEVNRAAQYARSLVPEAPTPLTREEQAAEAAARG